MSRIIYVGRSVKPFGTTRRDLDYIIDTLMAAGHTVDICDPKQCVLMHCNTRTTESFDRFPEWMRISKLYLLLNFFSFMRFLSRNKGAYDVVHAYYMREEYLLLPRRMRTLGKKLVLHLFGSDINLRNPVKDHFTKLYSEADAIVTSSTDFRDKFLSLIRMPELAEKMHVLIPPQDHFSLYRDLEPSEKHSAKQRLGLSQDKLIILVGTNATENEQHEAIVETLTGLEFPERYQLVFMLTRRSVEPELREKRLTEQINARLADFEPRILTSFLSFEDMRDYRFASDIFLNFRRNDQLAASMLESNLAYCEVITGDWLPYGEYLRETHVFTVSAITECPKVVTRIAGESFEQRLGRLRHNKEAVLTHYDSNVLKNWLALYGVE